MTTAVVDVETINLHSFPGAITVWEIGLIVNGVEYHWQLEPDMGLADETALKVGRFEERLHPDVRAGRHGAIDVTTGGFVSIRTVAHDVAELTDGAELWGSNPAFDMRHLGELLAVYDIQPGWHYHPNDIPSVARGWCAAKGIRPVSAKGDGRIRSDDWSRAIGVDPDDYDRHTALGDCRWVLAQYELMLGPVAQ